MKDYQLIEFPKTRIATFDVGAIGRKRHHVSFLLEIDITDAKQKIRDLKQQRKKITFTGWILKIISDSINENKEAGGYLLNNRKLIVFNDINISTVVEKEVDGYKVPIPLVIEKTNEKSTEEITQEIDEAKKETINKKDIVLKKKSNAFENLYYYLPGFARRAIWQYLLKHPKTSYRKMGNVIVTSIGMMGKINGWFIPTSVHPISFGIGSILKKPLVIDDEIKIREVLHVTVLMDHNVIDGAPMARYIDTFTKNIENAKGL